MLFCIAAIGCVLDLICSGLPMASKLGSYSQDPMVLALVRCQWSSGGACKPFAAKTACRVEVCVCRSIDSRFL